MKGLTGDSVLYIISELKPSNEVTGTYCKPVREDCQSTDVGKNTKKCALTVPVFLKERSSDPLRLKI